MFSIVKFKSDGSVETVSSSWLSSDRKLCKWPVGTNKNITNLIKSHKFDSAWPDFEIKLYKTTGNFKIIILFNFFQSI